MVSKKRYSKAFYDDGLGDILEWIDDEVLASNELKAKSQTNDKRSDRRKNSEKDSNVKTSKQTKLYGDNELSEVIIKKSKKIKFQDSNEDEPNTKQDKRLEDRVRGLINRLAAQTMPYVTSEFEKLYSINSRSSIDMAIFNNVESAIIQKHAVAKRKIVAELMLLTAYLDHKISHGVGASLVHRLVKKFEDLYRNGTSDDDKRLNNLIFCLVNLYIVGLISANVIFEVTKRICSAEDFTAKSIELLLIVMKSIGFQLRKDKPSLMRQLIMMAQENCRCLKSNSEIESRVGFMMEALGAIKNNNVNKIGNYGCDIDKDTIEFTLKSLLKRSKLPECLSDATYGEILNSTNWYLLETRVDEGEKSKDSKASELVVTSTKMEIKICKAIGLNKPIERTILGALLRVSDFVEASNIIIGFGLNYCSDAMLVCIHVAMYEKKYNPFYYNIINNLCKFNRKYKMAAKFAIQDKIRALSDMASQRVAIFKQLCFELIQSDAIPLTILKAVEWANLSTSTKEYLTFLFKSISDLPEEERAQIMIKVEKKSSFAGAMRTFINCFVKDCKLFQ